MQKLSLVLRKKRLLAGAAEFNRPEMKEIRDESHKVVGFDLRVQDVAENLIEITDEKTAASILRLMSKLEEHDDIQNVYSNFDISDELMEKIDI